MIRLSVRSPQTGWYQYRSSTFGSWTDSQHMSVKEMALCNRMLVRNFSSMFRWPGDVLRTSTDKPHVPRECHHRKLEADVRINRGVDTNMHLPGFDIYQYDTSRYVLDDTASPLFPKDHHWILTGEGKRPINYNTSYVTRFPTYVSRAAAADFVSHVCLDRDRYSSAAPWRYSCIVRVIAAWPIYLRLKKSDWAMCYVHYSASFSSRWEVGVDEDWSSDESISLDCPYTNSHWDFLSPGWKSGYPYNRIFRRHLPVEFVMKQLTAPTKPDAFHYPDLPIPNYESVSGEGRVWIQGLSKATLENYKSAVIGSLDWAGMFASHITPPRSTHQKDLHLELIQNLRTFDSNLPLYLKDLPKVGGTIQTIMEALHNRDVSSVASSWLSLRFADRLTWADTKELKSSLEQCLDRGSFVKQNRIKRSARDTVHTSCEYQGSTFDITEVWNSTATFVPRMSPETAAYDTLRRLCQEWDIISAENVWDAIPYSFVVDWLVDVAGVLNILDAGLQSSAYQIKNIWDSVKRSIDLRSYTIRSSDYTFEIEKASYVWYDRVSPDTLKLPVFTKPLEPIGEGFYNWKHIVDTGMLIVQRIT